MAGNLDAYKPDESEPVTADDAIANLGPLSTDVANAEAAAAAGVKSAGYINYDANLEAHEARSDIEPLADRRARESGTEFADTDFMRVSEAAASSGA